MPIFILNKEDNSEKTVQSMKLINIDKKRYSDRREIVQKYMQVIIKQIKAKNNGDIPDAFAPALDSLADLYDIYYDTLSCYREQGVMVVDRFGNAVKNPLIKQILEISHQVQKIERDFGLTLKSANTIKDAEPEGDDLLDKLNTL